MIRPTRVVKVGGSLLDLPRLGSRLVRWMRQQPPRINVLLGGGGPPVERIRVEQRARGFDDQRAHWMAIDALRHSAQRLRRTLSSSRGIDDFESLRGALADDAEEPLWIVFDCREFMRRHEPHLKGTRLPCGWHVTSDSIAARLAEVIGADELVLLKSTAPDSPGSDSAGDDRVRPTLVTREEASETGYVDRFFPVASRPLPRVRGVNLRDPDFAETRLA